MTQPSFKSNIWIMLITFAVLLLTILTANGKASAEDQIDCRNIGGYGGSYYDIAYDNEYVYVGNFQGLSIFDVSDPSGPEKVGFISLEGGVKDVIIESDYAYIANGENGLVVVDISDPTDPQYAGGYNTAGESYGVNINGGYAYIADLENGLVVVDVSDPMDPQYTGGDNTSDDALGVVVNNEYAYIVDALDGLVVVDVSDPTDPQYAGGYDTESIASSLDVSGGYAFVGDRNEGMVVVDISNPTNPQYAGGFDTYGGPRGITVSGNYAFIGYSYDGLVVVDVSDPKDPQYSGEYDTNGSANDVAVSGGYAYVADGNKGLVVVDVGDPTDPLHMGGYDSAGHARDVVVSNGYAYIADFDYGLVIVDVSDPTDPQYTGGYETAGYAHSVFVINGYAYIADDHNGLVIVDVNDPTDPQYVGGYSSVGEAWDVAVSSIYAYIADFDYGLVIVDVRDPTDPQFVGDYNLSGNARGVMVSSGYAYIANWEGLVVLDVHDPTDPQYSGEYDTANYAEGLAKNGDHIFMTASREGFVVLDVSDPTDPQDAGGYDNGWISGGVALKSNHVYIADYTYGLVIIELAPIAWIDRVSPNSAVENESVIVEGHGTDESPIKQYAWRSNIDGELHNSTSSDFIINDLSNGTHTIYFKVKDNYGAWSNEVSETIVINGIPRALIDSIDPSPALDIDEVHFVGNFDEDGSIIRYVWRSSLDDEIYNDTEPDFSLNDLLNGTHLLYFKVQDNDGVWSDEVSQTLVINGKPRALIDSISPSQIVDTDDVHFVGKYDEDGSIIQYAWRSSRDNEFFNSSESDFYYNDLSNGTHTIYFKVQDNDGIWSDEVSQIIIINGKPRSIIYSINPEFPLDTDDVHFIGAYDEDSSIIRYVWRSNRDNELYNGTESDFYDDNLSNGTHTIYFKVQDNDGVWSDEVSQALFINGKPRAIIDALSPGAALDSDEIQLIGRYDEDGWIIRYVWRSSRDNEFFNGTELELYYNNLSNGTHTIYFKVQDNEGIWSDEVSQTLVINGKPRAKIGTISPNPALNTDEVHFAGNFEEDGSIIRYIWRSNRDNEFFNGTVSDFYYDNLSNGTHTIYFKVQDNEGIWSDEVSQTLVINGKPRAMVGSISPDPALDTDEVHFIGESDEDGSIIRYAWRSSRDNEFYNGTEPEFYFYNLSIGTHIIYFKVQDNNGAWSEEVNMTILVIKEDDDDDNNVGMSIILLTITGVIVIAVLIALVSSLMKKKRMVVNKQATGEIKSYHGETLKPLQMKLQLQEEKETHQKHKGVTSKCYNCGKPIDVEWQSCPYCSHKFQSQCPECEKKIQSEWVKCPFCSSELN